MKGVVFDLDGVIVDSEALDVECEKRVFARHALSVNDSDFESFKGRTAREIFEHVARKNNSSLDPSALVHEKLEFFLERAPELELFEGFVELADFLKPRCQMALATSNSSEVQKAVFNKFKLHKYFASIVTSEDVLVGKPHPEAYLTAFERLGLRPGECVVVEDSVNGVKSAKAAGASVIAVTHSFPRKALREADFVVENLAGALKLFREQLQ